MKIGNVITNPGELNKRITLKKRAISSGTGGFQNKNLITIAVVWAKWVGVHGMEAWAANTVKSTRAATVIIRYRSNIDETCVVVLDDKIYKIVSMDDIRQRHEYLELKVQFVGPG